MSRPTISTGSITFSQKIDSPDPALQSGNPMKIVILGDFSGRTSRGIVEVNTLLKRKLVNVDRDNFEEVFSKLKVKLKLPVSEGNITFNEFDNLHPDYIYEQVSLFDELRKLQRQLNNPSLFDRAAAEIEEWANYKHRFGESLSKQEQAEESQAQENRVELSEIDRGNMLDALLSNSASRIAQSETPEGTISKIIKDVIAPYVEKKEDSRKEGMLAAVTETTNEVMRKISHASQFQQLEASWRSVYMLVRRLETSRNLKIYLVDVSKDELLQDIENSAGELENSGLYNVLVARHKIAGETPLSLIVGDFFIGDNHEDILLATALAATANASGAAAICGGSTKFAGVEEDLSQTEDPADWQFKPSNDIAVQWNQLKSLAVSKHLALAAPRFMIRLPYGKQTSPIERFHYEELPGNGQHRYYLWGNSAYLVALLLAEGYVNMGWNIDFGQIGQVNGLPLHAYTYDGEGEVKPCAEILITDSGVKCFTEAGLLCIRSMKEKDSVLVPIFNSVNSDLGLKGPWG